MNQFLHKVSAVLQQISTRVHSLGGHHAIHATGAGQSSLGHEILIVVSVLLIVLVLAVILWQLKTRTDLRERLRLSHELMSGLKAGDRIEDRLNAVLRVVSEILVAPYYACYVWDERGERFMLRALTHPYDSFEGVGPSYSGLALPKKEAYLPPSALDVEVTEQVVAFTKDGEVPMVVVRIGDHKGVMRIGPVAALGRRQRRHLAEVSQLLDSLLGDWMNAEAEREKNELRALSDLAITKVASLASNALSVLPVLLEAFTGIVGGKGGIFIERTLGGKVQLHASDELVARAKELEQDEQGISDIEALVSDGTEKLVSRSDPLFYDIPAALTADVTIGAVMLIPFGASGTLIMLHDSSFNEEKWVAVGRDQFQYLTDQVQTMVRYGSTQRQLSRGYTRLLCEIADMVDNLNPYTVGYSDMMMHYSLVIGKRLGLSDGEMHDLALAARLSNIGVVGMDVKLLFKEGKYTSFEYGLMKRHAEISASMIEVVTGNRRAADYVLSHHERVDGNGYPSGLKNHEIPIGSKIIHVVQVFLAKVNGRSWRSPLTFEDAVKELRASSGTALDTDVVQAFESWWTAQAEVPGREGRNLGRCYEMCCVPRSICATCPAFSRPMRCWEMPDNHCKSHGRECSTCFVRTEYLYRNSRMTAH